MQKYLIEIIVIGLTSFMCGINYLGFWIKMHEVWELQELANYYFYLGGMR